LLAQLVHFTPSFQNARIFRATLIDFRHPSPRMTW
jgi:hypothetical protein